MKQIALWTFVVIWFLHLTIAAGAGYATLRLWANRANPLIRRMAIFMHATLIGALTSIVLVFIAKGVKLTWKFAIAWFLGTLLMDIARIPLIFYLLRGKSGSDENAEIHRTSGSLPPEHWDKKFDALGKKIDELKK